MKENSPLAGFLKSLGPGICFAGAAVGVSHIVQSTRAGALYGFSLLIVVILSNVIKFPFFEYGPRYTAATDESLLTGYKRVHIGIFYLFVVLSLLTMFTIQAAVTIVAAGLLSNLLSLSVSIVTASAIVLFVSGLILALGKYKVLDGIMKLMVSVLSFCTLVALAAILVKGPVIQSEMWRPVSFDLLSVTFLLALVGWMPAPIEISVWHSFWTAQRRRQTDHKPTLAQVLFDFHAGYWLTTLLAVMFLSLGAFVMYGSGETFVSSSVGFTAQVISLYTKTLGQWSYPIIAVAATMAMFSTTISVLDAYCRVVQESINEINPAFRVKNTHTYVVWMVILSIGALCIISLSQNKMTRLIDIATIISFISAPLFAYINLITITSSHVPVSFRPRKSLVIFSWFGIVLLTLFSLLYLSWKLKLISF